MEQPSARRERAVRKLAEQHPHVVLGQLMTEAWREALTPAAKQAPTELPPKPVLGVIVTPVLAALATDRNNLTMRTGYGRGVQTWFERTRPEALSVVPERHLDHLDQHGQLQLLQPELWLGRLQRYGKMAVEGALNMGYDVTCVLALDLLPEPRDVLDHPDLARFAEWGVPLLVVSLPGWRRQPLSQGMQREIGLRARKYSTKLTVTVETPLV